MADRAEFTFDDQQWAKYLSTMKYVWGDTYFQSKWGRKLLGAISIAVFKDIMEHFSNEEGPDGKWKPWSAAYSEHMMAIGKSSNKILQDTGRLRQSFSPSNYRSVEGGMLFYNAAQTAKGFPYAFAHDNDSEPRKKLPRRSFMWLSDAGLDSVVDMATQWYGDVIEEEG